MTDSPERPDAAPLDDRIAAQQLALLREAFDHADKAITSKQPVDQVLRENLLKIRKLGSRDRRLIRECVFTYFRWKPWMDVVASERNQKDARIYLSADLGLDRLPPALEQLGRTLGFPAATQPVCSTVAEVRQRLQPLCRQPLMDAALLPDWFDGAPDDGPFSLDDLLGRPPLWIRILHEKEAAVEAAFKKEGIALTAPFPHAPQARRVERVFAEQTLVKASKGGLIIQDLASQAVVDVCRRLPGTRWWDACCGAGGKSIGLADDGTRHVLASDLRSSATRILQDRRRSLPPMNLQVAVLNACETLPREAAFDGVLIDAPCTGSGTWGRNPDMRWRTDDTDLEDRLKTQDALLNRCAEAVRPGGHLVYSVCSLTAAETTERMQRFEQDHPDFQTLELPHPFTSRPWNPPGIIAPGDGPCNGMFIAVFQRKDSGR